MLALKLETPNSSRLVGNKFRPNIDQTKNEFVLHHKGIISQPRENKRNKCIEEKQSCKVSLSLVKESFDRVDAPVDHHNLENKHHAKAACEKE